MYFATQAGQEARKLPASAWAGGEIAMPFNLTRRTLLTATVASAAVTPFTRAARAQDWPAKPIRIIVGYPAGGATDLYARAYGDYIAQQLGQPVLVENKPGASGIIAAQAVKAAPADGYTLMFTIAGVLFQNRVLYKSLPYDPDKDFVVIATMSAGGLILTAHKSTGAKTLKDLVQYAKSNKVSSGTYAAGSLPHIVVAELNGQYGTKIEAVHYRGEAPMWQDLNAGAISAAMGSYGAASNVLQTGAGIAVAVWPRRTPKLPDIPTFLEQGALEKASGVQGFIGLFGPAGMPKAAVEKLSELMVQAGNSERIRNLMDTFGADEPAKGHLEFQKLYDREKPIWVELVSKLGLTPQ
jgi:tripartite-type tricarboxylate transporter receptor subunit TctC